MENFRAAKSTSFLSEVGNAFIRLQLRVGPYVVRTRS